MRRLARWWRRVAGRWPPVSLVPRSFGPDVALFPIAPGMRPGDGCGTGELLALLQTSTDLVTCTHTRTDTGHMPSTGRTELMPKATSKTTEPAEAAAPTRAHRTIRHVRASDNEWNPAADRANGDGYTISEVVRLLLRDYAAGRINV